MKIITIAFKDILQSLRSFIGLVFMFGVPILMTAMFYFLFGGLRSGEEFILPKTILVIVNLDQGSPQLDQSLSMGLSQGEAGAAFDLSKVDSMGDVLVSLFKSESLAELVEVFEVSSAEKARSIVDRQEAGVAIIIPERFSASMMEPGVTAEIEFYQDPTLTLGPGIIKSIVNQFLDFTLGTQIGMQIVLEQLAVSGVKIDAAAIQTALTQLLAGSQDDQVSSALIIRNPEGLKEGNNQQFMRIISLVMGGMMVFFAFYTGAATAGSILSEDENGTLARLFTTPTLHTTILGGKFLSVLLMVGVQVTVLLLFAALIFGVRWGEPASIMLAALGIVACASTFGIFLVSFLKNSRQGGVVFGGILTITGMIGIFTVFTMGNPNAGKFVEPMALIVPQGWVMRSLRMSLDGQPVLDILPFVAVTLGLSVIFFLVGNYRLKKRFA